jgi:hypothetical protein
MMMMRNDNMEEIQLLIDVRRVCRSIQVRHITSSPSVSAVQYPATLCCCEDYMYTSDH